MSLDWSLANLASHRFNHFVAEEVRRNPGAKVREIRRSDSRRKVFEGCFFFFLSDSILSGSGGGGGRGFNFFENAINLNLAGVSVFGGAF